MYRVVMTAAVATLARGFVAPQQGTWGLTKMAAKKDVALAKVASNAAVSAALAGAVLMAPTSALAARSGGRAGGSSFRSRPAPSRVAPRTTVRTYAAPVAVPVPVSPFGYGGYGYSPFGGVSTGTYLGLSLLDAIVDEQRRAAYLRQQLETREQLGKDSAEIAGLKAQLDAQEKRIAELQAQAQSK
mmetsp:Transcript_8735/g.22295  ORF Transcript_8735/g.22295 Transcript_8735/m.22295 type:complete len:186 (+) Transcript_8735:26-583(+)